MIKNILVVDDSALMRRVISDIINKDGRFHVSEYATNGLEALDIMISRAKEFDGILLDVNMPKMNGIEFLAELKKHNIKATVIIVSTIAKKDAKETIKALELGAFDFITKPESYVEVNSNQFSDRLLQCITLATNAEEIKRSDDEEACSLSEEEAKESKKNKSSKAKHVSANKTAGKLVALACSTGGPKALHTLIPTLPANLDAPMLIVQHMPSGFTKSLADRLNEISQIKVKEADDGDILENGIVYIAKGGHQMRAGRNRNGEYYLTVTKEPARRGLLPCADIMYESLTELDFNHIVCVVLTGMGGDGTAGITKLYKSKNIYVIAQDEESSVVYGMPKVIKEAGLVDEVLPLNKIADAITKKAGVH
ncbi:MAG: chemotaxis-specific protein-glutamate methyltransferase CheB [Clostridiales bacterium]|nr:chemotaxis-specific protein-glutamate methyltransferase CheB [Clostridiales bacterium]